MIRYRVENHIITENSEKTQVHSLRQSDWIVENKQNNTNSEPVNIQILEKRREKSAVQNAVPPVNIIQITFTPEFQA